jgi:hypothetical protein
MDVVDAIGFFSRRSAPARDPESPRLPRCRQVGSDPARESRGGTQAEWFKGGLGADAAHW